MPHYTGNQHGLIWEEYLQDDEYLADVDPDLDQATYQAWKLEDNLAFEFGDVPHPLNRIVR
jgi:hypothetical protein